MALVNETISAIQNTTLTDLDSRSTAAIIITALLLLVIMLASIVGNVAVILAVVKCYHLREEKSNILTVNLAITDLGNGLFVMCFAFISIVTDEWVLGGVMCDITCALNYCFMITSMITLFSISTDRYQAIHHPFHYQERITRPKLFAVVAYAWFQGLIFSIIPVIMRWVEYDYWEAICAINWFKEKEQAVYYVISAFLLCFLIPGLLLTYNYVKMLYAIKQFIHPIVPTSPNQNGNNSRREKQKTFSTSSKAIKSLLIVAVAYFMCFTPFSVTKLIKVITSTDNVVPGYVNLASSLIAYCSSAVNPLIYGIFRTDFRLAYKLLINSAVKKFGYTTDMFSIAETIN